MSSVTLAPRSSGNETVARIWEWLFLGWVAFLPVMIRFNFRLAHRYTLPFADFLFAGAAAAFLVALLSGARRWRRSDWYWPLLAYAGALALSTAFSGNIRHSAPKLAGDLYLIFAAVLMVNYVADARALRRVIFAWMAGAAMNIAGAAAGVILFYGGATTERKNPFLFQFGSLPPGHYPRIRALFLNANMMCAYMTASALIIVAAYRAGWISRRWFLLLFSGTLVTAAFSLSPGLGGLFLVVGLWLAQEQPSKQRSRWLAGAGIAAAVLFLAVTLISPTPLARTSLAGTLLHPEPSGRVLTWLGAWHSFLAHPWVGQGIESEAARVRYVSAAGVAHNLTDAGNTWLSILAQQGLAGFLAFAWVVWYLVRRFRPTIDRPRENAAVRSSLELALIGGFLYSTLSGSFENTRHVWTLMGLVAAVQELPVSAGGFRAG